MTRFEAHAMDYFKALLVVAAAIALFSADYSGHFHGAEHGWF
jgi:hypothetical protein